MLAIIGCGNPNRQDDGFGSAVIAQLKKLDAQKHWAGVELLDAGCDGAAVIFSARGASALIVVDANKSGSQPGTIYRVPGNETAHAHETGFCLHNFRWDHVLHVARNLFKADFPDDVLVLLVEEDKFGFGPELSPCVVAALEAVVARIVARIEASCASEPVSKAVAKGFTRAPAFH
jgi:hydrogenase maturation protease